MGGRGEGLKSVGFLRECVVGLAGIAMDSRGGGDVDDATWFAVLDTEVGSGGSNELERSCSVQGHDGIPLLVGRLMDDSVPCEARVVYWCAGSGLFSYTLL